MMIRKYKKKAPIDRFMRKVFVDGNCWIWTGYKKEGQGQFNFEGLPVQCRRWMFEYAFNCRIPKGKNVCVRCGNIACVNPDHLFLVPSGQQSVFRHANEIAHKKLSKAQKEDHPARADHHTNWKNRFR